MSDEDEEKQKRPFGKVTRLGQKFVEDAELLEIDVSDIQKPSLKGLIQTCEVRVSEELTRGDVNQHGDRTCCYCSETVFIEHCSKRGCKRMVCYSFKQEDFDTDDCVLVDNPHLCQTENCNRLVCFDHRWMCWICELAHCFVCRPAGEFKEPLERDKRNAGAENFILSPTKYAVCKVCFDRYDIPTKK